MAGRSVLLVGRLVFDRPRALPGSCRAFVRVIDAGLADAPARQVAVAELDCSGSAREVDSLPFRLPVTLPEWGPPCLVTAHLDLDGDGAVSRGDLVTMRSHPIRGSGDVLEMAVFVQTVR